MFPRSYFAPAYWSSTYFPRPSLEVGEQIVSAPSTSYWAPTYFSRAYWAGAFWAGPRGTVPAGFNIYLQMNFGHGWVNVTDMRTSTEPQWSYGIEGNDPSDRIADGGVLTFSLNNSEYNSAKRLGWYSPLNTAKRGGFDFNTPTRLVIAYNRALYYKFVGKLANVDVSPGIKEERTVHCTVLDMMDDWARVPAPGLPAQFDQRGDELVTTVLDALPTELQPISRDIDTGLEVHPLAFDTLHEETMTIREALNQVCLSDLGYLLIVGSKDGGGKLVYRNRHYPALHPDVQFALTGQNILRPDGLDVPGTREDLVSKVQVFVHSTRTDATNDVVLYDLQTTTTLVGPGDTNDTLFGPYRDPNNPGDRVGGMDMRPIVAVTDYQMNSASDGSGLDLTGAFTATASYTGAGVRFTITNNGSAPGYVTKLQARGRGIYRFTAVIDKNVTAEFGQRVLQYDMPFQNSVNVGNDVAAHLARQVRSRGVRSVTFLANVSPEAMQAALELEPGSARISITETVTGLDAVEFTVVRVSYRLQQAQKEPLLWCTWDVLPLDAQRFWMMGVPGSSEIGVTTVLGF
jgi:hypothetical protein